MRKWIPLLIIAAALIASAIVYPRLPERMATHWNMSGEPDGFSNRFWGAWMIPVFIAGMWVIVRILPAIDPRGANYEKFRPAFEAIMYSVMLFMLFLHIVVLRASLGHPVQMLRLMPIGIGLLFVVIGNLLPRARPNWFVGIRTPWTLSNDRVWERTHRFGGRVFVAGGLFCILAGLVIVQWAHAVLVAVVTVIAVSVTAYSYLEWKRERQPATPTV